MKRLLLITVAASYLLCGCFGNSVISRRGKKTPCEYEKLKFVGVFKAEYKGVAQFQRLKGGSELIAIDSVTVTGTLTPEGLFSIDVRRANDGSCGATKGIISRM